MHSILYLHLLTDAVVQSKYPKNKKNTHPLTDKKCNGTS